MRKHSVPGQIAIAFGLLYLGAPTVHAQLAPTTAAVPFAYAGRAGEAPSTEGSDAAGVANSGFSVKSYSLDTPSWGSLGGSGIGASSLGWAGSIGYPGSFTQDGARFDYTFKGTGGLPVSVFAGVDTLKYKPDVFNALTSLSPGRDQTLATGVHAGFEFKPTSNLSLSFSAGFAQPSGAVDSDIRSNLLPGETPMFSGGRR